MSAMFTHLLSLLQVALVSLLYTATVQKERGKKTTHLWQVNIVI